MSLISVTKLFMKMTEDNFNAILTLMFQKKKHQHNNNKLITVLSEIKSVQTFQSLVKLTLALSLGLYCTVLGLGRPTVVHHSS